MTITHWGVFIILAGIIGACAEPDPLPRRHGFHRIDLPQETQYVSLTQPSCPFSFEYPDYGEVTRSLDDSCWVDLTFDPLGLKWHFNYRHAEGGAKEWNNYFEDHRKLVFKHSKKATQIKTSNFTVPAGEVTFYEVYGNVGTPAYAFLVDSSKQNLFMMSFYFETALKNDSLAPIIDYMKEEVYHTLQTLEWE